MQTAALRPRFARISLRELALLVAFLAIGCGALRTASNAWWTALSAIALLLVMGAALVAAVDRGPRQAFALGFVICVAIYGVLFVVQPIAGTMNRELDPYEGRLPTTRLLAPLFRAMVTVRYFDAQTGVEIPNYDPKQAAAGGFLGSGAAYSAMSVSFAESPQRQDFLAIGHLLWALLLGYAGGHVARVIYLRRVTPGPDSR